MRRTYTDVATATGRGLRAALGLGCLSAMTASLRSTAPGSPRSAVPAAGLGTTPATHVFTPLFAIVNAMKDQGTRPPREVAALH